MSPVGPRVPVVKAYPIVMPPDTESDEEHKATKAYPETPGEHTHTQPTHTHTYKEQSRRAQMHAKRRADTCKPTRHVQYTYEHTNRQINTKAGGCTYSLAHLNTHRHWQSIKNTANRGLTQTQTRWYSLAQQLAITSNI